MTKRGRLNENDLEFYESNIAGSDGIMRRILRALPVIRLFITDDEVLDAVERDLEDSYRYASNIRDRNKKRLEEERRRKRGK